MRLDQAVAARFSQLSRRKARELIAQRRVLVNERPVAVASREVVDTDRITLVGEFPPLDVIRETPGWIAVYKPPGLAAQPARARNTPSLEELLRVRYGDIFLVHRLDTPTSGVMIFGRTQPWAARLSRLFADGEMRKVYLAVIDGALNGELTIETPIGGRAAQTVVRPLGSSLSGSLVEVEIKTGRTHQIRIHLASVGHPIVGDRRYGGSPGPRLMLHAWKLIHAEIGELIASPPGGFSVDGV